MGKYNLGVAGVGERTAEGQLVTEKALRTAARQLVRRLMFGGRRPEVFIEIEGRAAPVGAVHHAFTKDEKLWLEVSIEDSSPAGELAVEAIEGEGGLDLKGSCQFLWRPVEPGLWAFLKALVTFRRRERQKVMESMTVEALRIIYR
jgi:hypothetical protein